MVDQSFSDNEQGTPLISPFLSGIFSLNLIFDYVAPASVICYVPFFVISRLQGYEWWNFEFYYNAYVLKIYSLTLC